MVHSNEGCAQQSRYMALLAITTAITPPAEDRTFVIMYHTHGAIELLLSERTGDQRLGDGAYRWAPDYIQTEM